MKYEESYEHGLGVHTYTQTCYYISSCIILLLYSVPCYVALSSRHVVSSSCRCKRRPQDMEGSWQGVGLQFVCWL